jgi:N utilization substance protein A
MKNEFVLAFNEVLEEKQLPKEIILEALEAAMVSAYRRAVNASNAQHVEAKIDLETGDVKIFSEKEIVEKVQDERTEVSLEDAQKVDENAKLGGIVIVDSTPQNFGRVAAQTARQVIQQRIREAERDAQLAHFSKQMGEIMSGVIQAINSQAVTLGLDMKAEGVMPRNHQIPGEKYRVHDRIRALLLEVKSSSRGPQIVLSRAHRNFLRRLLENEVPEIYHGMVEIRSIAREPGQRSKVAVSALQAGVDPVGACVGLRGVRIQAIVKELDDEKIDVIEWNPDPAAYIAKALSPARVTGVYLNDHAKGTKTATVVVPEDQLSLAIGRDGQNARLAARLTSWRIDIKSLPEAGSDAIYKLQNDPEYAAFIEQEVEVVSQIEHILAKKAEGRPVTPEEYQLLSQFVDRIEKGVIRQWETGTKAEEERQKIIQANIPEAAFEIPLEDLGIPLRYSTMLSGAGFISVGDLMLQMKLDSNVILGLSGIGAKAFQVIEEALNNFSFPGIEEKVVEPTSGPLEETIEAEAVLPPETEVLPEGIQPMEKIIEPEVAKEKDVGEVEKAVFEEGFEVSKPEAEVETFELSHEEGLKPEGEIATEEKLGEEAEKEPASLEEIFSRSAESLEFVGDVDADEDEEDQEGAKKKKKKKKYVEYEYDPDQEVSIYKKQRKRSGETWDDEWSL